MTNEVLDLLYILIQNGLRDDGRRLWWGDGQEQRPKSSLQAMKMVLMKECVIASLFTDANSNYNPLQLFLPFKYPVPGSTAVEQPTHHTKKNLARTPMLPGLCINASPNTG